MVMTLDDDSRLPLRQRVKAAGGWYSWFNKGLIRVAGPAAVGPYESTPAPTRTDRPCPLCGAPMTDHRIDRSGERTQLYCP